MGCNTNEDFCDEKETFLSLSRDIAEQRSWLFRYGGETDNAQCAAVAMCGV
jgi:hypothetical protein